MLRGGVGGRRHLFVIVGGRWYIAVLPLEIVVARAWAAGRPPRARAWAVFRRRLAVPTATACRIAERLVIISRTNKYLVDHSISLSLSLVFCCWEGLEALALYPYMIPYALPDILSRDLILIDHYHSLISLVFFACRAGNIGLPAAIYLPYMRREGPPPACHGRGRISRTAIWGTGTCAGFLRRNLKLGLPFISAFLL